MLSAALVSSSRNIINRFSSLKVKYVDNLQLHFLDYRFQEAGQIANSLMTQNNIAAFIAQGRTAQIIQNTVDVPVINIEHSCIDVINILSSSNYKRAYIPATFLADCEFDKLTNIFGYLGININLYDYQNEKDLMKFLNELGSKKSYCIVLGGPLSCKVSTQMGIDCVELCPSDKSVINTLDHVVRLSLIENRKDNPGEPVKKINDTQNISKLYGLSSKKALQNELTNRYSFSDIIGSSEVLFECKYKAMKFSKSDFNVLLIGETGTGKEMFAQAIHQHGDRKHYPFLAVNCATIHENLLESELFGYEDGAFSGAKKGGKLGLFESVDGGTIFLDEIDTLKPSTQAALLRVIQEKQIIRVGGNKLIPVDVRMIFAANELLTNKIKEGLFRKDLYYRISELTLNIPPLRQRREDLPDLIKYFLTDMLLSKTDQTFVNKINDSINLSLNTSYKNYSWPGNIRELENLIKRIVVFSKEIAISSVTLEDIIKDNFLNEILLTEQNEDVLMIPLGSIQEMEKELIDQACKKLKMNKTELAKRLGISRSTLWRKQNK